MRFVEADFETFSRTDLTKVGAWKYAEDLSTFIMSLQLKLVVDKKIQPTRVLTEKQVYGLDPELLELCNDTTVMFLAHNAGFEQAMWHFHMVPAGYPPLPPERWHDTMATAAMKGLPLGLDAVVKALELPIRKDMEGHAHMLKMCKPDKDGTTNHHTPENLNRLYSYGAVDVEAQLGLFFATGGLGPDERAIWILDQKIQQRGLRIDTEFVHACMDVLEQVRTPMTERFRELTGLKPTQREKVLNWVNDQGVALGDMKKATLDAILDPDDEFEIDALQEPMPPHVYEVIKLRRALASSSVAKLERMLMCAGNDGRVRYTTQYHGARTGRDAGRLIQIQNYPRGEISDRQGLTADILADAIMTRNVPYIQELWGEDIFSAVISSLRSCIVPADGKVLCSGDFAAVEARNLLSMAGQHDRVDQMHNGLDVYSEVASLIYKRPINRKIQVKEGQIGKNTFLGCLASDTQVLTSTGWKRITCVKLEDKLWDGQDWVTHNGLAYKGLKETLSICGLRLTTDHAVFDGVSWFRAGEATKSKVCQALAFAKVHGPSWAMPIPNKVISLVRCVSAIAEKAQNLFRWTISKVVDLQDVSSVQKPKVQILKKPFGVTQIFALIKNIGQGCLIGSHQFKVDAVNRANQELQNTMWVGEFQSRLNGHRTVIADPNTQSNQSENFLPTSLLSKVGIIRLWRLIVSTMMGIMHPVISGSLQKRKTWTIADQWLRYKIALISHFKKSKCCEPVYDLVNAGPRHRFTVMTASGPLVVHNSGYGLGEVGFQMRFAPKEPIELARLAINTYRKEVAPMVPKFWYGLFQASVDAVWCEMSKTYTYEGIEFRKENDFLTMRLPSGRKIWYHRPRKATTYTPAGDERPSWSFMSYQGKKFRRHLAWHGMVTADCIQGSARDLMTGAARRAEKAGLRTIFKVHDELVFEENDRPDLATMVAQIMEDSDPWAVERRFRVKANVEVMLCYRK